LLFFYGEEYTEELVWKGEKGDIAFLNAYRYGRAVSHISAQDVDPRRWLKNSTITALTPLDSRPILVTKHPFDKAITH
jgi:hypothetical protein